MCNAWNHGPDCACGFGGDGHLGGGHGSYGRHSIPQFYTFFGGIRELAKRINGAIVYPTTCKYCGQSIFLYANEYGSFVIFESLGVPWPKHNCRNYSNIDNYDSKSSSLTSLEEIEVVFQECQNLLPHIFQARFNKESKTPKKLHIDSEYEALEKLLLQVVLHYKIQFIYFPMRCDICKENVILKVDRQTSLVINNISDHKSKHICFNETAYSVRQIVKIVSKRSSVQSIISGLHLISFNPNHGIYEGIVVAKNGNYININTGTIIIKNIYYESSVDLHSYVSVDFSYKHPQIHIYVAPVFEIASSQVAKVRKSSSYLKEFESRVYSQKDLEKPEPVILTITHRPPDPPTRGPAKKKLEPVIPTITQGKEVIPNHIRKFFVDTCLAELNKKGGLTFWTTNSQMYGSEFYYSICYYQLCAMYQLVKKSAKTNASREDFKNRASQIAREALNIIKKHKF